MFCREENLSAGKYFFRVKNIDNATTLLCVILVSLRLSWRKYLPVEIEA